MPAQKAIKIWKGNTTSLVWRFKTSATAALDLTGSEIVLVIAWDGGELRKSSSDGTVTIADPTSGQIEVDLTPAETRLLPTGSFARYEIERRISGTEVSLVWGAVDVGQGVNDDAA